MTNNTKPQTHTGNTLSLNIEFDQAYWDSMTEVDRICMLANINRAIKAFRPVKNIETVYTAKTWQRVLDGIDGTPRFERQSDAHGFIEVAYDAAYLRYQARSAMTGELLTESADNGIIASGDTAEEVMDLIDAGWDN